MAKSDPGPVTHVAHDPRKKRDSVSFDIHVIIKCP